MVCEVQIRGQVRGTESKLSCKKGSAEVGWTKDTFESGFRGKTLNLLTACCGEKAVKL